MHKFVCLLANLSKLGKKYGVSPSTIKRLLDTPQFVHLGLGKYAKVSASSSVNQ